jgi:hypothetical protein
MSTVQTPLRTELAQRSSASADVTLFWQRREGIDSALIRVSDRETGTYFEIPAEPYLALDIYQHPFVYRDFSTVEEGADYECD